MASMTSLVYYASVSRGSTVVAEHRKAGEDLVEVEVEKVPPFHNQFTYTMKQRMFMFLMDDGFTYCAVVDEALGKGKGFGFLEQVRDEFKLLLRSRGLVGARLAHNALVADFANVFKHLVKPLTGVPQKEVDNDEHHSDSKDETALSPSASRVEHSSHPAPLTPVNGHPKPDKKSTKHQQVVQVKEIMMTNSGKALDKCQKLEGSGGGSSDMDHCGPAGGGGGGNRKLKGRQVASRMWWRNVKLVLILDLVVCCVLFAIWLGICKGFNCVRS